MNRGSKRVRLSHAANGPHETLLEIGFAERHTPLVGAFGRLQFFDEFAALDGQLLTFIHQVDFFLTEISVTDNLFVLIVHRAHNPLRLKTAPGHSSREPLTR